MSRTRWSKIASVQDPPPRCVCHDRERGCQKYATTLVVTIRNVAVALCDEHYPERVKWDASRGRYEVRYEEVV